MLKKKKKKRFTLSLCPVHSQMGGKKKRKEIKDLDKWKDIPCLRAGKQFFWVVSAQRGAQTHKTESHTPPTEPTRRPWKTIFLRWHCTPKLIYTFNTITVKSPPVIFAEIDKQILKCLWKCKGHRIAKKILISM